MRWRYVPHETALLGVGERRLVVALAPPEETLEVVGLVVGVGTLSPSVTPGGMLIRAGSRVQGPGYQPSWPSLTLGASWSVQAQILIPPAQWVWLSVQRWKQGLRGREASN